MKEVHTTGGMLREGVLCVCVFGFLLAAGRPATSQVAEPQFFASPVQHRVSLPPPLRLAERPEASPLASLQLALVAAPEELERIRFWNQSGGLPLRNGFSRPLPESRVVSLTSREVRAIRGRSVIGHAGGLLSTTAQNELVWGAEVRVEGAHRLRLHLTNVDLPEGTLFWVYGEDSETSGPFGLELSSPEQELWTPSVPGGSVRLEVLVPLSAVTPQTGFTIDRVMEIFVLDETGEPISGQSLQTLSSHCLIDAECVTSATFDVIDGCVPIPVEIRF